MARATQANAAAGLTLDQAIEDIEDFQAHHSQRLAAAVETRASAELALDQALDNLANADFNYGQSLATALQAVASAELARDRAQEDLDDFQRDHLTQIVHARMEAADAALAQKRTLDRLAGHAPAHAQDLADALLAKTVAEAALKAAENALEDFEDDTAAQMELAVQGLNTTTQDLEDANDALDDFTLRSVAFRLPRQQETEKLAELHRAIDEATDRLTIAQSAVLALGLTTSGRPCRDVGPDLLVHRCQELSARIVAAAGRLDIAVRELEVLQSQGDETTPDRSQSYLERQQLEAGLEVTQTALDQARDDLAELEEGPDVLRQGVLESALDVAKTRLDAALKNLEDTKTDIQSLNDGSQKEAVAAARLELTAAQDALAAAQAADDQNAIAAGRARVAVAQAALTAAEEALDARNAGVDPLQVAALEARVKLLSESLITADRELAGSWKVPILWCGLLWRLPLPLPKTSFCKPRANWRLWKPAKTAWNWPCVNNRLGRPNKTWSRARKDLAELELGPDPLETALLEAQISSGTSAVNAALEDVEGTVIRAEFSGMVSRVNVDVDDMVTDKSRIISLVDPRRVEVHGFLDATNVQSVQPGNPAQVVIDSLAGVPLTGVVASVSSSPRTDRGVLTFPIVVEVNVPAGVTVPLQLSGVSLSIAADS